MPRVAADSLHFASGANLAKHLRALQVLVSRTYGQTQIMINQHLNQRFGRIAWGNETVNRSAFRPPASPKPLDCVRVSVIQCEIAMRICQSVKSMKNFNVASEPLAPDGLISFCLAFRGLGAGRGACGSAEDLRQRLLRDHGRHGAEPLPRLSKFRHGFNFCLFRSSGWDSSAANYHSSPFLTELLQWPEPSPSKHLVSIS